jgi:hypothetical protein
MKLMDVITQCGARVCEGADYQWECYGPNSHIMEFADVTGEPYCSIVFDKKNYMVYELEIFIPGQDQVFKWQDSEHEPAHNREAQKRNVDITLAYDDVKYDKVADEAVILQYAKDIGEMYYDDLPVPESHG